MSREDRVHGLSPQQIRVIELLSEGLSIKEIGEKMGLSWLTVKNYRHAIGDKLEAKSSAQIVRIAFQLGILTIQPGRVGACVDSFQEWC